MKALKISIKIILLCFLTIVSKEVICQTSFTYTYSTLFDEVPFHATETEDGMYIFSAKTGNYQNHFYNTMFFKLNKFGDTVKTLLLSKNSDVCIASDLIKSDDGNYFCPGMIITSDEACIWLLKISPDLEILMDTTYSVGVTMLDNVFGFIDHKNHLVIYGNCYHPTDPFDDAFIFTTTLSGESLQFKSFPDPGNELVFSMVEKSDSAGYYMAITGDYQNNLNSFGQILTIDTNLIVTNISKILDGLDLYFNLKVLNESQLFLTGKTTLIGWQNSQELLCILKMDTNFQVSDSLCLGPYDTINYPAYLHNLSFIDTNTLYYGGTCNQALYEFSSQKSFFLLGCLTSTLDKKWEKYIGGDMYYTLWGVVATSDMGCLLLGCTYDYQTQNMERDILVIKVDSTGIMTSANGHDIQLYDAMVYPNPGTNFLYVRSGPQIKGARMVICDINGKQVSESGLDQELQQVDTRSFLPGTYVWQIIVNNRVIQTGKWIKSA